MQWQAVFSVWGVILLLFTFSFNGKGEPGPVPLQQRHISVGEDNPLLLNGDPELVKRSEAGALSDERAWVYLEALG
jgi:hypothetical protein